MHIITTAQTAFFLRFIPINKLTTSYLFDVAIMKHPVDRERERGQCAQKFYKNVLLFVGLTTLGTFTEICLVGLLS